MLTEFEPSNLIKKKKSPKPNQNNPQTPFSPLTNKNWIADPFPRAVHSLPKGFAVKKTTYVKTSDIKVIFDIPNSSSIFDLKRTELGLIKL